MTAIITIIREKVDPVARPRSRANVAAARTNPRPAGDIRTAIGNGNENGTRNENGIGNRTRNAKWQIATDVTMRAEDSAAPQDWATIPAAAGAPVPLP